MISLLLSLNSLIQRMKESIKILSQKQRRKSLYLKLSNYVIATLEQEQMDSLQSVKQDKLIKCQYSIQMELWELIVEMDFDVLRCFCMQISIWELILALSLIVDPKKFQFKRQLKENILFRLIWDLSKIYSKFLFHLIPILKILNSYSNLLYSQLNLVINI